MQEKSPNAFKVDKTTVFDLDKRFAEEEKQEVLF